MTSHLRATRRHLPMGSHSVTYHPPHPAQVNSPHLTPARQVLDLPTQEGWKAELT